MREVVAGSVQVQCWVRMATTGSAGISPAQVKRSEESPPGCWMLERQDRSGNHREHDRREVLD